MRSHRPSRSTRLGRKTAAALTNQLKALVRQTKAHLVWMETPPTAFRVANVAQADGEYDPVLLKQMKARGEKRKPLDLRATVIHAPDGARVGRRLGPRRRKTNPPRRALRPQARS